nr:hypothetical protein [Bacilli bacterium]
MKYAHVAPCFSSIRINKQKQGKYSLLTVFALLPQWVWLAGSLVLLLSIGTSMFLIAMTITRQHWQKRIASIYATGDVR